MKSLDMQYAFSTLSCPAWSIEQVVAAARTTGYDGVELRLLDGEVIDPVRDAAAVERAVAACREGHVEVPILDTSCRFNIPQEGERAEQVATLRRWVALAGRLGVPLLRVFGGADDSEGSAGEADARVAGALASVAPEAESAGVTIALETHDAYSSAWRVARVLDAVRSAQVAALWDLHHPYRLGEAPEQVIEALGSRIAFVHVKDARRTSRGDDWDLVLLGEGEVPVRDQLAALARHGYDGWVSVEWEKKWHPEIAEPEVALPQHIAWLKGAVHEPES